MKVLPTFPANNQKEDTALSPRKEGAALSPRNDDIDFIEQMLDSIAFSNNDPEPSVPPPKGDHKLKGVQVLPPLPQEKVKQADKEDNEISTEQPKTQDTAPPSLYARTPAPPPTVTPSLPMFAPTSPLSSRPGIVVEPTRMSRAAAPASASTPAPSRHPALRATTSFASFAAAAEASGRTTINMDDLLDEVIHSIVSDDTPAPSHTPGPPPNVRQSLRGALPPPKTQPNQGFSSPRVPFSHIPSQAEEELLGQILSNEELNIAQLERNSRGPLARDWLIPFTDIESLLQSKLGIGNHGEAYRPTIWQGRKVVVKKWNTTLPLSPPLLEEIATLIEVQHTHLVPLITASSDGRSIYTLTEYVNGANLHGFLRNGGLSGEKDSAVTILRIAREVFVFLSVVRFLSFPNESLFADSGGNDVLALSGNSTPKFSSQKRYIGQPTNHQSSRLWFGIH